MELKFYSSIRLDVRKIESLKQAGEFIGNRTRIKVVKNKVAPPFKEAEFDIMFGQGISREGDILDLAVNHSIIQKSGAWFAYNSTKIGQGRENAKQYLREHEDICLEVEKKVRDQVLSQGTEEEEAEKAEKPAAKPEKPAAKEQKPGKEEKPEEKAGKPEEQAGKPEEKPMPEP